jgi:hypothetical protein
MTNPAPRSREAAIPLWVLGLIAAFFAVSCISLWLVIGLTRPTASPITASPIFVVVANTPAVAVTASPLPNFTPHPNSTSTIPPNVNLGNINLGALVQVVRTGGIPLNVRQAPSLKAEIAYRAVENQVFRVENGPTIADGFTWWQLVDLVDKTRSGWAVENYLQLTNKP